MQGQSGSSVSSWMPAVDDFLTQPLTEDLRTDVCIVGGGIAGLSVAYRCAAEGKSVILLAAGAGGGGETCRTTAHLSNAMDDGLARIAKMHGSPAARLAVESHGAAIDHRSEE